MEELEGKVAIVTGGGSGIGKGAALKLAEHGAKIAVVDRDSQRAERAREEIERMGGEALALEADVASEASVRSAIEQAVLRWGRLDVVFANAGINGTWTPIEHLTEEDWDSTININLKGTFLTLKHAIPHLKRQGGGSVIFTSSVNGNRIFSNIGASAYSTSKAGQTALMQMAKMAGYTQQSFEACLTNQKLLDDVNSVRERGAKDFGVNSTPTFLINGKRYSGDMTVETMSALIDSFL